MNKPEWVIVYVINTNTYKGHIQDIRILAILKSNFVRYRREQEMYYRQFSIAIIIFPFS